MSGLLQLAGALIILVAFVAVQSGLARPSSPIASSMNLAGSAVLAVLALRGHQWGFLLLEASWAAVSAASLGRWMTSRPSSRLGEGSGRRHV
jgi:hypothetical protein